MKVIWTKSKAEYHGEFINFDPMMAWPKPARKPHPPVIVGGGFPQAARRAVRYGDGWMPVRRAPGDVEKTMPLYKKMLEEAGRKIEDAPMSIFGARADLDGLKKDRDMGIVRVVVPLDSDKADKVLPVLDQWAELIRKL